MVNQSHNGPGDNVVNKYENIVRSIEARDLESVVNSIMQDVRYRNISSAREQLHVLTKIDSLDSEVKLLLDTLLIKVDLSENIKPNAKQKLLTLLRSSSLPATVHGVATSILIDLESRTQPDLARDRYKAVEAKCPYVKEAFYEFIATEDEIDQSLHDSKIHNLLEQELTGLVRGYLRTKNFERAVVISQELHAHTPSSNSQALMLYSESCFALNLQQNKHYSLIDNKAKANIERLIGQLLEYADYTDNRVIASLMNLLNATSFSDRRLLKLGAQYLEKISYLDSKFAESIKTRTSNVTPSSSHFELVSNVLDLDGFTALKLALDNNRIKRSKVAEWCNNGGLIKTGDDYMDAFLELYLKACLCAMGDKGSVKVLEEASDDFLKLDNERLSEFHPLAIMDLCERFIELGVSVCALGYLRPILPAEPWVSPIFECYLNALIASEKYELFLSQIRHLSEKDKTQFIWILEAQVYGRTKKHELAIRASRAAIELEPNNPHSWYLLLFSTRDSGASVEVLKNIVFEIPEQILSSYHESKISLINEIAIFIDINLADRILVDWFVTNPEKVAKLLTQVHVTSLFNRPEVTMNPYVPKYCCDGVIYSDGFSTHSRILVRDVDANHTVLLDIESPLGQLLDPMEEGETVSDTRLGEITLVQRLPPYVAVFQQAIKLRDKNNDGTDVFKLLTLPSNEEDIVPYLERFMKHFSPKDKGQDELLQNPNIPLVIRGKYTDPGCPIKGAITHLTSMNSTQYIKLFDNGIQNPEKVVLDIYTAVYFSLMGLASSFKKLPMKIVFSEETNFFIQRWIKDTLRDDYLSLDYTEKGIYRYTSEDIKRTSLKFINELKVLIDIAEVEALKPADTPDNLLKIRDIVDGTVYSTIQLSVANEIPLLSVDHIMCMLSYHSHYPVASMRSVVIELLNNTSLEAKKQGIELNLILATPVPIIYDDVIRLSLSSKDTDIYLVAKFIEKYGSSFESQDAALNFLTQIGGFVTVYAFLAGNILVGHNNDVICEGHAVRVFNYCCRAAADTVYGDTAEMRLALFLFSLIHRFGQTKNYHFLLSRLASNFATGHFMDINEINKVIELYASIEV